MFDLWHANERAAIPAVLAARSCRTRSPPARRHAEKVAPCTSQGFGRDETLTEVLSTHEEQFMDAPHGPMEGEAVLDIGGDVGALILYTDERYAEQEIEVSPEDDLARRIHTAIHQRRVGGRVVFAGIFPQLRMGTYRIWTADPTLPDRVTIIGGRVAEVDWRTNR